MNILVQQNLQGSGFSALGVPVVDPTTTQVKSAGSRISSLTTAHSYSATASSITIYWDGTNNSDLLRIYRDDGTIAGPYSGNQAVTGLTASTTYFFYAYFDESAQVVRFVSQPGIKTNPVGSPPIAYPATDILVGQQQLLRGRVPLFANLTISGIATSAATAVRNGGGGGGGGSHFSQKF